jgi:hypothetical protein
MIKKYKTLDMIIQKAAHCKERDFRRKAQDIDAEELVRSDPYEKVPIFTSFQTEKTENNAIEDLLESFSFNGFDSYNCEREYGDEIY